MDDATHPSPPATSVGEPAAAAPVGRRWRFQYSLATLMWLVTLAACLSAMFAMYRRLHQAEAATQTCRAEVRKYRDEMGYLDVSDRSLLYARQIPTILDGAEHTMRPEHEWWRVYLPEGHQYKLRYAVHRIPKDGLPERANAGYEISAGEQIVEADATWSLLGKVVEVRFYGHHGDVLLPISETHHQVGTGVSPHQQTAVEPGSPLVLTRVRGVASSAASIPDEPCDGYMIWIEEQKQ